jgi:molybdopterin-guanine dinucleotide biosynthesis protein A
MSNQQLYTDMTAVILAGGECKRIGLKKPLLNFDGEILIEKIFNLLKQVFEKVIISTNEPDDYKFINTEKLEDIYKGFGPLGGIHSALKFVDTDRIFIVAADMPFLIPELFKYIINIKTNELIVLPEANNQIQYLCGIYSKGLIQIIENILKASEETKLKNNPIKNSSISLWNFVDRVGAQIINVEEKIFFMKDLFFNINTMKDYEYAKERIF